MQGRAFTFGDDVDTDVIRPSEYFELPIEERAKHVFEPIRPDFYDELGEDNVVVAGESFGCGSSREDAATMILEAGVEAVVADSFARIFYRNAIVVGLPAFTCPGITGIVDEGDEVGIDFEETVVENLTTGEALPFEPLPEEMRAIFDAGGLVEYYRTEGEIEF